MSPNVGCNLTIPCDKIFLATSGCHNNMGVVWTGEKDGHSFISPKFSLCIQGGQHHHSGAKMIMNMMKTTMLLVHAYKTGKMKLGMQHIGRVT